MTSLSVQHDGSFDQTFKVGHVEEILRAECVAKNGALDVDRQPASLQSCGQGCRLPVPYPTLPQQHLISSSEPLDRLRTGSMYRAC